MNNNQKLVESFVFMMNESVLHNSPVSVRYNGYSFELYIPDCPLIDSNGVRPTPLLEIKIEELIKRVFVGCLPRYNNTRSIFTIEEACRYVVCVHDKDRNRVKTKLVYALNKSKMPTDEAMSALGFHRFDNTELLHCEKLGKPVDNIPSDYWQLMVADGDFHVERCCTTNKHSLVQTIPQ